MGLPTKTLKKIGASETVKGMLADKFGKKIKSINRWIDKNDTRLTCSDALEIYETELGITQKEALGK